MFRACSAARQKFLTLQVMSYESLQLESLSAGYASGVRAGTVVRDFTATVSRGTFVCVLGCNGAGKSTLLRTVAGLQRPTGGRVLAGGRDIASLLPNEIARTVGVVLTDRRAFATQLTAGELAALGRIPHTGFFGGLSEDDRRIVAQAMKAAGIEGFEKRRLVEMSDGERQKAMIARTLAQQTPVILLDEPTAFLDFPSETGTFRFMRRLAHEEGKTVIAATHNIAAALQTADCLWLLQRGETPVVGTPRELAAGGRLDMFFESAGVVFDRGKLSFHIEPYDNNDSMYR